MPFSKKTLTFQLETLRAYYQEIGFDPQSVTYQDIVAEIADFLLKKRGSQIIRSYGNEAFDDSDGMSLSRFDPIALYQADPDRYDEIVTMVEAELDVREEELLRRRGDSISAYNTLVFGAARRMAQDLPLSPALRSFISEHLISPQPPVPEKKKRGQPKHLVDDLWVKRVAIMRAIAMGLKATRADNGSAKTSACDAVSDAARRLYQEHGDTQFVTGYSYDALKKVWQKP